jgi:hypothetical protein
MAASGGRACVRSLRGGVLWRSRYGRAGGCWGRDQHRPSQALRAKPVLVAGSPRVGLTGRTRSHLSASEQVLQATAWTVKWVWPKGWVKVHRDNQTHHILLPAGL